MSDDEAVMIQEAIIRQKVGCNAKTIKQFKEHADRRSDDDEAKIRIRIAKLATRTIVKWKRHRKKEEEDAEEEEDREDSNQMPTYTSRILRCTRCEAPQETRWMQLRTTNGYRAIYCKECKRQETCARNLCQCKLVWRQCLEHRVDPLTHSSRKGRKGVRLSKAAMNVEKEVCRSSGRKAPRTDI